MNDALNSIWQDLLALGIILAIALVVYAKIGKKSMKEALNELMNVAKEEGRG